MGQCFFSMKILIGGGGQTRVHNYTEAVVKFNNVQLNIDLFFTFLCKNPCHSIHVIINVSLFLLLVFINKV